MADEQTHVRIGSCTLDNIDMLADGRIDNVCAVQVRSGTVKNILRRMPYNPVRIYWYALTLMSLFRRLSSRPPAQTSPDLYFPRSNPPWVSNPHCAPQRWWALRVYRVISSDH